MKEEMIEIYRQCLEQRKHYDKLSWTIGGAFLLFNAFIIKWSFESDVQSFFVIAPINIVGIFLAYSWNSIYERNRMFVEVANELARDIERKWEIDGIGIKNGQYSVGPQKGMVAFENTDSQGNSYADKNIEKQSDSSSHFKVRYLKYLISAVHIAAILNCLTN